MPLYDYRCDTCGDFEAWRKLADLAVAMTCPTCDSAAQQLFVPPNINLNSGSFSRVSRASKEPRLAVKRSQEPSKPRVQNAACSRPWMIGHAPERL